MQNSNVVTLDSSVTGAFKVDTSKGGHDGRVSSQWFSRPADQKFTSMNDLYDRVKMYADQSRAININVQDVQVRRGEDENDLRLVLPERLTRIEGNTRTVEVGEVDAAPNHWSFGQMCQLLQVPAGYLRKLPSSLAGINMQYALKNFREEVVKAYVRQNGVTELRAATGVDYGRILDSEVVEAVRSIAGNGTGDTNWKIPGVLNWKDGTYNPYAEITKESTTLFASDRDVFLFLVDDTHPIEIGKLANGDPDLLFRGFYVWNSEVGSKSFGLAAFYLRGVCQNRNLWGVEGFQEMTLRHSKNAPNRFIAEARPALADFANKRTDQLIAGVKAAKEAVVAKTDDERKTFLKRQNFTDTEVTKIIDTVMKEEGKPANSIWDFVQGITAVARGKEHQDARIDFERRAGKLLDKVAA